MTSLSQRAMKSRALPYVYERVWRPFAFTVAAAGRGTASEQDLINEFLELKPGDHVLDIACGPGNTSRRLLAALGSEGRVTGLDAAPLMIERARADSRSPRIDYVLGDATALPFDDESFDAVTCLGALYLVDDAEGVIDEMVRVLKPGGHAVALTSTHRGPDVLRPLTALAARPAGVRVFGSDEITAAFEDRGLTAVRRDLHGFIQIVRGRKPAAA